MKRHSLILVLLSLCCLLSVVLTGCGSGENANFQYVLAEEPVTLDPQVAADESAQFVITALYEGLTRLDASGAVQPGVATHWDVDSSGTVYTFYLRQDSKWSDESPVTAKDFQFAFRRAVQPETGSTVCRSMDILENAQAIREGKLSAEQLGVTVLDDYTLQIRLCYADPDFPTLLSEAVFMPCKEDYFTQSEGKYGTDSAYTMGNGPFRMENRYSWEHGAYINLIRSETYVGEEPVSPAKLTITIADNETGDNPLQWLENGDTDGAYLSSDQTAQAEALGCTVTNVQNTTWGLCFNTQQPSVRSAKVRCALLQAVNRSDLLKQIPDDATAAEGILPPDTVFCGTNYRSATGTVTTPGTAASRIEVPAITVLCPNTDSAKRIVNEMITAWNREFNHYYNMEPLSEEELNARIASGDFEAAILPVQASSQNPRSLLSLFHSDSKQNPALLNDSAYDKLLTISNTSTAQSVLKSEQQAERYLVEQGIFYPLYYETDHWAVAPSVQNATVLPYNGGIDFSRSKKLK